MTHSPDKINILTACDASRAATKSHVWDGEEWATTQFDKIKSWSVFEHSVNTFDEMAAMLRWLSEGAQSILIRDRLKSGFNALKVDRRKSNFVPQELGLRVLGIDIDDVEVKALTGLDEIDHTTREGLEYAVEGAVAALLPESLWGCSVYYQWSASAGVKPWTKYRLHLWFFLDRPVYRLSLKRWAQGVDGIDSSFFDSVRVHYTASPQFRSLGGERLRDVMGADDRGPLRSGVIRAMFGEGDAATAPEAWLNRPDHEALVEGEARVEAAAAQARVARAKANQTSGEASGDELVDRIRSKAESILAEMPGADRHGFVMAKVRGLFGYRDVVDPSTIADTIRQPVIQALRDGAGRSQKVAEGEAGRLIDPLIHDSATAPAFAIAPRTRKKYSPPARTSRALARVEGPIEVDATEEPVAELVTCEPDEIGEVVDPRLEVGAELSTTKSGEPKTTLSNCVAVLTLDPRWRGVIAFDELALTVITTREPPWGAEKSARRYDVGAQWSDGDDNRLRLWLQREYGFEPPQTRTREAVDVVAEMNSIHPVRDWLATLDEASEDWQGVDSLLNTWLIRYTGAEDTPYTRLVGRWWLIAAVARVHPPKRAGAEGVKADNILVLEGKQGQLKSTVFRTLPPVERWFSDSLLAVGEKDALQSLRGKWLYELAELDGYTSRKEAAILKAFVTSAIDDYRPSYGARNVRVVRQCLFCGTANKEQYLRDLTGNRRFWSVKVGDREDSINIKALAANKGDLWAQALAAYNAEEVEVVGGQEVPVGRWWPVGTAEREILQGEQLKRLVSDSWETSIQRFLRERLKGWRGVDNLRLLMPSADELLRRACGVETARFTNPQRDRVRLVMTTLGFKEQRTWRVKGGPRERFFLAPESVLEILCPKSAELRLIDSDASPF